MPASTFWTVKACADGAMHVAKPAGRDRYEIAPEPVTAP